MLTCQAPGIEEYAESKTQSPCALLNELQRETHQKMRVPQMLTGPLEGTFLRLMAASISAKSILEVGMFTGYSALSMAEGLPADGKLVTLEIEPEHIAMAKKYFERSEHGKKIEVIEGPALDSLKKLKGPFDLVFIDADKENYINYYEDILPKVRPGGVILVDNVLWGGKVLDPQSTSDRAVCAFNDHVCKDDRVDRVLLTVRDGVFFLRKK